MFGSHEHGYGLSQKETSARERLERVVPAMPADGAGPPPSPAACCRRSRRSRCASCCRQAGRVPAANPWRCSRPRPGCRPSGRGGSTGRPGRPRLSRDLRRQLFSTSTPLRVRASSRRRRRNRQPAGARVDHASGTGCPRTSSSPSKVRDRRGSTNSTWWATSRGPADVESALPAVPRRSRPRGWSRASPPRRGGDRPETGSHRGRGAGRSGDSACSPLPKTGTPPPTGSRTGGGMPATSV